MAAANFDQSYESGATAVIFPNFDGQESKADQPEAVTHFRRQLKAGFQWHRALLEAIGRWTLPEEYWKERRYKYIIGQEAFDWLLLAERLCEEAGDDIPTEELEMLLFHGVLPEPIETAELRRMLGASKHQGYLNYHYGVVLEEVLQLAAEETIRKRHTARGYTDSENIVEDAYRHLYNDSRDTLLNEFRRASGLEGRRSFSITDLKEFTYWLHKRRVNYWDPARVASDTRLAIRRYTALQETGSALRLSQ